MAPIATLRKRSAIRERRSPLRCYRSGASVIPASLTAAVLGLIAAAVMDVVATTPAAAQRMN